METASPDPASSSSKAADLRDSENASTAPSSIRFLISNVAAGSVIGKGGATISDYQAQSGAGIHLSRNHEYFPGTTDRIISISGIGSEVLTALHLILGKILNEIEEDHEGQDLKTNQVKLIVPSNVCGAIIGKGGATIKMFVEDSGANIKLSSQDQSIPGVSDRIVTITGTLDQQLRAVALILTKLIEDPNYSQYVNTPISYPGKTLIGIMSPVVALHSQLQLELPVVQAGPLTTSITIAVPDERIGAIVGRGGKIIIEIQQACGVKIKISDRGDFITGTKNRKVTIAGTAEGVRTAQHLLTEKVRQSMLSDYER
ncbi:unnamed protein product [Sphagnum troendelagicum]|uniref:K Homology domain-containing protein n=1 Tax=Sphagnum troendelagicum TaxID=128251 RepID=A0ABP0TQR0_9BRYO